ncbi:MAG: hypothetical protein SFY70_13130 [Bacteroidia bacterium]|nr:hypothetical protein [Bacteroidia bacterium]
MKKALIFVPLLAISLFNCTPSENRDAQDAARSLIRHTLNDPYPKHLKIREFKLDEEYTRNDVITSIEYRTKELQGYSKKLKFELDSTISKRRIEIVVDFVGLIEEYINKYNICRDSIQGTINASNRKEIIIKSYTYWYDYKIEEQPFQFNIPKEGTKFGRIYACKHGLETEYRDYLIIDDDIEWVRGVFNELMQNA